MTPVITFLSDFGFSVFRGRAVFGPVAAHLANGLAPEAVGPALSRTRSAGWPSSPAAPPRRYRHDVRAVDAVRLGDR